MLPTTLPPSAALTVAELLGPLSALLLLSQLAILGVLMAWLLHVEGCQHDHATTDLSQMPRRRHTGRVQSVTSPISAQSARTFASDSITNAR